MLKRKAFFRGYSNSLRPMDNLLRLLQLCDPILPIGGFSHSYGLETYVQQGLVFDEASAREFIIQMLRQNIQYTDAAFVSLAYDATVQKDFTRMRLLNEECTALKVAKEIRHASHKLGARLLKVFGGTTTNTMVADLLKLSRESKTEANYSIVFGAMAAAFTIEKKQALTGFYYNSAAGMVTNSVKLIPLGQQVGQQILFSLKTLIETLVEDSMAVDPSMVGLCCSGFDIRCMQHERLYSRLYMS